MPNQTAKQEIAAVAAANGWDVRDSWSTATIRRDGESLIVYYTQTGRVASAHYAPDPTATNADGTRRLRRFIGSGSRLKRETVLSWLRQSRRRTPPVAPLSLSEIRHCSTQPPTRSTFSIGETVRHAYDDTLTATVVNNNNAAGVFVAWSDGTTGHYLEAHLSRATSSASLEPVFAVGDVVQSANEYDRSAGRIGVVTHIRARRFSEPAYRVRWASHTAATYNAADLERGSDAAYLSTLLLNYSTYRAADMYGSAEEVSQTITERAERMRIELGLPAAPVIPRLTAHRVTDDTTLQAGEYVAREGDSSIGTIRDVDGSHVFVMWQHVGGSTGRWYRRRSLNTMNLRRIRPYQCAAPYVGDRVAFLNLNQGEPIIGTVTRVTPSRSVERATVTIARDDAPQETHTLDALRFNMWAISPVPPAADADAEPVAADAAEPVRMRADALTPGMFFRFADTEPDTSPLWVPGETYMSGTVLRVNRADEYGDSVVRLEYRMVNGETYSRALNQSQRQYGPTMVDAYASPPREHRARATELRPGDRFRFDTELGVYPLSVYADDVAGTVTRLERDAWCTGDDGQAPMRVYYRNVNGDETSRLLDVGATARNGREATGPDYVFIAESRLAPAF